MKQSKALGESLIAVANEQGVPVTVVMTDMDSPLGLYSGHRLEVKESLEILKGEGPRASTKVTHELAKQMLKGAGLPEHEITARIKTAIDSGKAMEHFEQVIHAQGGSLKKLQERLKRPPVKTAVIKAPRAGYLRWNTRGLGLSLIDLGAGRWSKEDKIDPDVGLYHPVRTGETVTKGQEILRIVYKDKLKLQAAKKRISESFNIREEPFAKPRLIRKILST